MVEEAVVVEEVVEVDDGEAPLGRRLAAEFVGTLLLVAVGAGAATVLALGPLRAFQNLLTAVPSLAQAGPDQTSIFTAILGNSLGDVLPVAFAFTTILAMLVYAFGGVSGAHFNPAVTFGLAVSNRFKWKEVPMYWLFQILGGVVGGFIIAGMYGQDGASLGGTDVLFGTTTLASGINQWQGILAEAFIAFILMTAIMAVAVDHRAPKGWSGLIIGLALGGGILVTATATGGSANFARTLGPMVASLPYDVGKMPWGDLWVYAVGPIIGASAAALVYESLTGLERITPEPTPGAATGEGADDFPPEPPPA